MDISLDIRKSIDGNAVVYFEKAKKAKRKIEGAEKAIEKTLAKIEHAGRKNIEQKQVQNKPQGKKWFEKFRWFVSSEGFLCVGGRDATTNEIIVKKHAEKGDIVFHTDMSGSPFFVVKADGKKIGKATLDEAGIAVASFSRAWKLGVTQAEVFYATPEQLTKTPKSGEYLEKGSFIVEGKVEKSMAELKLAVGIYDSRVMCGPLTAVTKNCPNHLNIAQGSTKASDAAKLIRKKLGGHVDDIIRSLPSGGVKVS